MFWQDDAEADTEVPVAQDIFDLVFKISGDNLATDHAFALSRVLTEFLSEDSCKRIGVHQIRMAESGNGWTRPQTDMVLSRRAKLAIRTGEQDYDALQTLVGNTLDLAGQSIQIGESSVRKLSTLDTLFAHAVVCEATQSEEEFMNWVADQLNIVGIRIRKMICGTSGLIRTDATDIFTRSLLVSGLKPEESITLQRTGIGNHRLLGCGIFVPHKGIAAVYQPQQQ